jgi:hypothetical protein
MLSIVASHASYGRLASYEDITILKPISDCVSNPIRPFLVEDPSGYTIEFFS